MCEISTLFVPARLPEPDDSAKAVSQRLLKRVEQRIQRGGGWLAFEDYMEMALYEPGLGYYPAGSTKLGAPGDFVTAPELTPLFARCLAAQIGSQLDEVGDAIILELGPGTGRLAADLLAALEESHRLPQEYWLLEPSPDLAERQRSLLARYGSTVRWLQRLPEKGFSGVVIANEVADALPVQRFEITEDGVKPMGLSLLDGRLQPTLGAPEAELGRAVEAIQEKIGVRLPVGYRGEVCRRMGPWIEALLKPLHRGSCWIIDYGLPRTAYYHPQHRSGRLVCHYRHRQLDDPYWYPGLCDLSAWVDFSALAEAAQAADAQVAGFTTQAQWLLATGVLELAGDPRWAKQASQLATLLLPGEMGERFKVLTLAKSMAVPSRGRDMRSWL